MVFGHYGYPAILYRIGWSGVDLFFVLSGLLISGLLFKEYRLTGSIGLKRFWIRRGFKIYPAFYGFLIFTIISYALLGKLSLNIFSDLFFMQDYFQPIAEHGWSLGVEEKFYIVLPILLVALMAMRKHKSDTFKPIPYIFLVILVACLAFRLEGLLTGQYWFEVHRQAHMRLDALFAGVTLGYYKEFHAESFRRAASLPIWLLALPLLLPILFVEISSPVMVSLGATATLVGFAILVLWSTGKTLPGGLGPIAWVGKYSYSIYLWNLVVESKLGHKEAGWGLASLPFYLAASIGVGFLAAYLIETPFLALRDTRFPAKTA